MALVVFDRVRETSTTTGTGNFTLAGAVTGHVAFSAVVGANTFPYTIAHRAANEWEVGIGSLSGGALVRSSVLASSNAGAAVNFSAGTKDVFLTAAAALLRYLLDGDRGDVVVSSDGATWSVKDAAIDHGGIGGLADDDHAQYALLAGRSGGQTLIGGTASGQSLFLQSTSHATRGLVVLNDAHSTVPVTPAQITSDQNDYALATKSYVRLSTDANGRKITGIVAESAGQLLTIHNVGSNLLTLAFNHSGSAAANRILTPTGYNLTLKSQETATLIYDFSQSLWVVIHASDLEVPGTIKAYAGASTPGGYLNCDGSAVSRTTYAGLFAAIGTTWGSGDGSTTFNLPDGRGRAIIGNGQGSGLSNRIVGATGGAETHQLTTSEIPAHTHSYNDVNVAGGINNLTVAPGGFGSGNTGSMGGGGSHNNMPPYFVGQWVIKI